jgi:hypothetical protein
MHVPQVYIVNEMVRCLQEAELLVSITEVELAIDGFASKYVPLITSIVQRQLTIGEQAAAAYEALAQSALLALCKMMCISGEVCEKNLQLLFTVLGRARSPALRATVATALGDMMFRFPNMIEPYTHHMYARLRDADPKVRKNTLMVLTHLILNGMVKVKGQIGEIAVCLHDPERRIVDLTKMVRTSLHFVCTINNAAPSPYSVLYCSFSMSSPSAVTVQFTTSCQMHSRACPSWQRTVLVAWMLPVDCVHLTRRASAMLCNTC